MHDYQNLIKSLRYCATTAAEKCETCPRINHKECNLHDFMLEEADAIEELLAVCRDIAAFVICFADDDEVSAEVLCRKLHKIGVIEKDGAWWTLPEPPKEEA